MSKGLTPDKDLNQLIRKAQKQGWQVSIRRAGHIQWISPDGLLVISGATNSDFRAIKNIRAQLRKRGFVG